MSIGHSLSAAITASWDARISSAFRTGSIGSAGPRVGDGADVDVDGRGDVDGDCGADGDGDAVVDAGFGVTAVEDAGLDVTAVAGAGLGAGAVADAGVCANAGGVVSSALASSASVGTYQSVI